MPKFFFNVVNGASNAAEFGNDYPDMEGTSFPDIYAAQAEAVRYSAELLRDLGASFWNEGVWRMDMLDERRRLLLTLTFSVAEPVVQNPIPAADSE